MPTIACPGCGMPRAEELVDAVPCPVCGPTAAAEPLPPPAPREPAPRPAAPSPVVVSRSRFDIGLGFCAGIVVGLLLALFVGRALRSESRADVVREPVAVGVPTSTMAPTANPVAAPPVLVPEVIPQPLVPVIAAPVPHAKSYTSKTTGLEMVLIEGGEFQMGSWNLERGRYPDEPEHRVRITRPYYLGMYEVTQGEYFKTMDKNPSWFSLTGGGREKIGGVDPERLPVEMVTWYDAIEFCNSLSLKDGLNPYYHFEILRRENDAIHAAKVTIAGGHGYRLPTEAEWEYACRAGTKTPFHFGSDNTGQEANVKATMVPGGYGGDYPRWKEVGRTAKVGSYPRNRWLLRDMHGNVAEWCWDFYARDYYLNSPVDDPTGPDTGHHRMVRGGSWMLPENSGRSATRFYLTPDDRKNYVGLRVARTP